MKFTVGMKVYRSHYRSGHFDVHTVTKVYKNGNFLLDDGKKQYRPDGYQCGGIGGFVSPLTDEILAELNAKKAAADRRSSFFATVHKIYHLSWRTEISESQLERIETLLAELTPK